MDTIGFAVVEPDDAEAGPIVAIRVNGRDFLELVHEVEMPFAVQEGYPDLAGGYDGLLWADIADLRSHFHGDTLPYSSEQGKTYLYDCGCGVLGCWPLMARIVIGAENITWCDFEQPHRTEDSPASHWRYDGFGPFVFERAQYEEALKSLPWTAVAT